MSKKNPFPFFMGRKKAQAMIDDAVSKNAVNQFNIQREKRAAEAKAYEAGYHNNYLNGVTAGQKYAGGISGSGSSLYFDHRSMRQNARRAVQESLEARAIAESFASNIVGKGLKVDPTPDYELLGITPEEADEWSRNVSRRYDLYSKDKKQHRQGTMSWYQYQRLYAFKQQRDNDNFTRFYYSKNKGLQNPLQFGGIDPNQVRDTESTNTVWNYNRDDYGGIEYNADGSEKAYKIWVKGKNQTIKEVTIPRKSPKTGKTLMVHGFQPEYDGQTRGYSRFAPILQDLEDLANFTMSALKKAVNQSQLVYSVENDQQTPGNPVEDNVGRLSSAAGSSALDMLPSTGVGGEPENNRGELEYRTAVPEVVARTEASVDVPGSQIFVLNKQGDKVKPIANVAPADQFDSFVNSFYDRCCAAVGTSSEVVKNIYGKSYTAIRATLVSVWRRYAEWRQETDTDLIAEHYEMWMAGEIAKGNIKAPGWSDPVIKAAWLNHGVIGEPMPQSDPGKEAKALKEMLTMNLTTQEREARSYNGSSFSDNVVKNKQAFKDSPLPPWEEQPVPAGAEMPEGEEEDD